MIEIVPNWHPIFVHFTVALLSTSAVFFLLTVLLRTNKWRDQWMVVAYWNLWLGLLFSVATGIAGWLAYGSVAHDTPSHAAMTDHRNWAIVTLALFFPLGVWSLWHYRSKKGPGLIFIIPILVAVGLLLSTAWRGGEIVYRYGLGVMSMPKTDDHGHDDSRGESKPHRHNDKATSAGTAREPGSTMKRSRNNTKPHRHDQGSQHDH